MATVSGRKPAQDHKSQSPSYTMPFLIAASAVALFVVGIRAYASPLSDAQLPAQAQFINQSSFNVLPTVLPPSGANSTTLFIPPGKDLSSLKARPFHVYDQEFLNIIGSNPTLTLIADSGTDPLFHEAVVWYPETDEVFFVQNAGAPAAGTGLKKSNIIQKISQTQAAAFSSQSNAVGKVDITTVTPQPNIVNTNGGTNYKGQILFAGEGQGDNVPPALWVMNPKAPYNASVLVNNYFGRQFNSLNDIAINPRNKDIYFTDPLYGYLQDFRPAPGLPTQVYRLNDRTGAVTVVADHLSQPNGITFSHDGAYAYIADTGAALGFWAANSSLPATIYRYDVKEDGTFENRKTFAYVDSGVPDGVHCDSKGNVFAGCGDGVHVWNPSGKLLGKIYVGEVSANFQLTGNGRMVICAETHLYFVTLAASYGNYISNY